MKLNRISFKNFEFDIHPIRLGYYSAIYFLREKIILENEKIRKISLTQIFNRKKKSILCGIDETLALLYIGSGFWKNQTKTSQLFQTYQHIKKNIYFNQVSRDFSNLKKNYENLIQIENQLSDLWVSKYSDLHIKALHDGDIIQDRENVLTIEGDLSLFSYLESIYLGILARGTKIASQVKKIVEITNKPILFFSDRFDRWSNQISDGYAALKAGVHAVATKAMGEIFNKPPIGTIPHSLIAVFEGDQLLLMESFHRNFPNVPLVALVDFENNCVDTTLKIARHLKEKNIHLWGVRLDTSENLIDMSLLNELDQFTEIPSGVSIPLVEKVRYNLDQEKFYTVKIIVSSGFNLKKIKTFEKAQAPIDFYAIGSFFNSDNYPFTADVVQVNGKHCAKYGRKYIENKNLKVFHWEEIL